MPEDINLQPHSGEESERNENRNDENGERFESDTQKIIRRHLENEDDVITDEDIASVRIGMVPPEFDKATEARFEDDEAREELEENVTGEVNDTSKDENLDNDQITPWDAIDPGK